MEETRKRKHAKESEGEEKNEDQMKEENGHYEGQVTNKDDSGKYADESTIHKSKKGKKKKKNKEEGPSITYNIVELFQPGSKRQGGTHLHFSDIRALLMLTVHGDRFPCQPTWCRIRNWMEIRKTLVVAVTGVSENSFKKYKDCFQEISRFFDLPAIPIKGEGNDYDIKSALKSLLFYRMPKKLIAEKSHLVEKVTKTNGSLNKKDLLLSEDRLLVNDFPVWNSAAKEHGVKTTRGKDDIRVSVSDESEMFAIDCEMCKVAGGETALTRISVVNSNMETVYDAYVKPELEIIDYLTQYSGITPDLLKNVMTRLKDVQRTLKNIIKADTIMIGHSLDFDLRAIKLHHDHVIDTSEIYHSSRGTGFKPSLKYLASHYLKQDIQASSSGHCSIEDAKTCMELVLLKLKNGASYGEPVSEDESIFEALARSGKTGGMVAGRRIVQQHPSCQKGVVLNEENEEFVKHTKDLLQTSDYIFTHVKANKYKGTNNYDNQISKEKMIEIDTNIGEILKELPSKTLVVMSFSGVVPASISAVFKDKEKRKSEEVKAAIKEARQGLTFVKITC